MKRRILSLATMLMMLTAAFAVPAFAAEIPKAGDTQTATVKNVESGATVTAYQIVEADYNANGFVSYKTVSGVTVDDPTAPTSDEVGQIAQNTSGLTAVSMTEQASGDYTADLAPGYWLVLVEGTGDTIYNPMLVSVYYSVSGSDNTMVSEPVDASANWTLVTEDAYAKSNTPEIDKEIVSPGSGNENGDDVAVGNTVHFQVTTKIPSYSSEYTSVVFTVTDTMSEGLKPNQDAVVTVGGAAVSSPDVTISYSGQTMTVAFASDYILANGLKDVAVTYSAELTEEAGINFDANSNTAKLTYTHNPGEDKDGASDTVYTYTFGIDASLNGSGSETTNEITKTGTTTTSGATNEPLSGATFTLTNDATGKTYTATSDASGQLSFTGLDAGSYTLVETEAPAGYSLNNANIPVVITAEYNADGTLKSYSIEINGEATSTYTATYDAEGKVTNIDKTKEETEIPNTKLAELPSTGGSGIYLFTIAGVCIMALAVMLGLRAARRNK